MYCLLTIKYKTVLNDLQFKLINLFFFCKNLQDDRTITPDEDNEAAIARSLQTFGQVISSLAMKSKQVGENVEQNSIEVPYNESVCTLIV